MIAACYLAVAHAATHMIRAGPDMQLLDLIHPQVAFQRQAGRQARRFCSGASCDSCNLWLRYRLAAGPGRLCCCYVGPESRCCKSGTLGKLWLTRVCVHIRKEKNTFSNQHQLWLLRARIHLGISCGSASMLLFEHQLWLCERSSNRAPTVPEHEAARRRKSFARLSAFMQCGVVLLRNALS